MGNEEIVLSGRVLHITYKNDQNGYTVFVLSYEGDELVCVGNVPYLSVGDVVTLTGYFTVHQTYGEQFKVIKCEKEVPTTEAAILRYLSSGAVKGIGPATAQKIVRKFGSDSLEIIKDNPKLLGEIRGISLEKAERISKEYREQSGLQELMLFLSRYDISPETAARIYKKFGSSSADIVSANPYALCCEEVGFSFEHADELAEMFDIPHDCESRIEAGVEYVISHNLLNGHTCLPKEKVIAVAARMLECDKEAVVRGIDALISSVRLCSYDVDGTEHLFLANYFSAEKYAANRLFLMHQYSKSIFLADPEIDYVENKLHIKYDEMQRKAIHTAFSGGVFVLTGGPGTGKTTTLNGLIELFENKDMKVLLAAPTGRAAQRMSELTNREAKTLHRLLEVQWGEGDKPYFDRNERNPLVCDVIVVDEMSMVDSLIFESLLRALRIGTKIILVGDSDQLPSVSAGNVLRDIIESGMLPSVKLSKIFRQTEESLIIKNAHAVINGEQPSLDIKDGDFFMLDTTSAKEASETVIKLCAERLPKAYGFSAFNDIQVLCPSRKLELGTINLNLQLQKHLNPISDNESKILRHGDFIYREKDKVMQIKNNYDVTWQKDDGEEGIGVYNGDIGVIETIDIHTQTVKVRYYDKVATYFGAEISQLEPAYAVTVHKSQGSEFNCVILPLIGVPSQLLYRNLLYTAITRAKRLLIVVGDRGMLQKMVENDRKTLRYTGLKKMICEAFCDA